MIVCLEIWNYEFSYNFSLSDYMLKSCLTINLKVNSVTTLIKSFQCAENKYAPNLVENPFFYISSQLNKCPSFSLTLYAVYVVLFTSLLFYQKNFRSNSNVLFFHWKEHIYSSGNQDNLFTDQKKLFDKYLINGK